jgi:hypothetical protein
VKAAAALKDKHGGRAAAAVLVPYGESLGIHQPDPVVLSPEQLAAWERHFDPQSGHSFFYSPAYDAAVWEGAVKLSECSSSSNASGSGRDKSSKQDVIQHAHRHLYSSHRLVLQEKPPADDDEQQKRPTSKAKSLK